MYLIKVYGKGGIYAKVVAASIANDIPIYTLETKAPKFIDAEFEKHRMLSSNSSSSRAIPFWKQELGYIPFDIRANKPGMQGEAFQFEKRPKQFKGHVGKWRDYILTSIEAAGFDNDIHKQHLSRYLEPWMFQKKVITATEWDNFFKLRLAEDAQPEIQELARCMKEAINRVKLTELKPGEWHLPYTENMIGSDNLSQIKCSVARCARVSYMNHDNTEPDIDKDLALYDTLLSSGHCTPLEHQAVPMEFTSNDNKYTEFPYCNIDAGITHMDIHQRFWSGNFRGWIQNRQLEQRWNV